MGSIGSALSSAISGLNASQQALGVISNNIANANTEGYSRRVVNQAPSTAGGVPQGVEIESITRQIDAALLKQVREQEAKVGYSDTLNSLYDRVAIIFGSPGDGNSLTDKVDDFFASLTKLSDSVETASLRTIAVQGGVSLASAIADTAQQLEDLRLNIDQEYARNINQINNYLTQSHELNKAIKDAEAVGESPLELIEQRENLHKQLGNLISINVDHKGFISTTAGVPLLGDNLYQLEYISLSGVQALINDSTIGATTISAYDEEGNKVGTPFTLVSAGTESSIVNNVAAGQFRAYTDMRDSDIPNILAQLDQLASILQDSMNAIHNGGTGFPSSSSLTATRTTTLGSTLGFSGSIMLGVVDSNGNATTDPYDNSLSMRPLTLDLGSLNSGSGAGKPTTQDIIDEINNHYGFAQPKVQIGSIDSINLVSQNSSIDGIGAFSFDLEIENLGKQDANVTVQNITITDGISGAIVPSAPAAFPDTTFAATAGDKKRYTTDGDFTFTGTGNFPYTINVQVSVNDPINGVTTDTITYVIEAPTTGTDLDNVRFEPSSVSGAGDATFVAAPGGGRVLTAFLADENGNPITATNQAGYIKIVTDDGSYGIVIDELNSKEVGTGSSTSIATNRGFSHYFGMNDFFVNQDALTNSAINLEVRSDLISNPNKVSLGQLELDTQPSDEDQALYTYHTGKGNNKVALELANLRNSLISYNSAGTLPSSNTTFGSYSSDIIAFVSTQIVFSESLQIQATNIQDALEERFLSGSGVNIDEELANLIIYQHAYSASAKIITTADELMQTLLDAI